MEGGRGTGGSQQQQHVPTGAWVPLGIPGKGRGPGHWANRSTPTSQPLKETDSCSLLSPDAVGFM